MLSVPEVGDAANTSPDTVCESDAGLSVACVSIATDMELLRDIDRCSADAERSALTTMGYITRALSANRSPHGHTGRACERFYEFNGPGTLDKVIAGIALPNPNGQRPSLAGWCFPVRGTARLIA